LKDTRLPPAYAWPALQAAAQEPDVDVAEGVGVGAPPEQAPPSCHTPTEPPGVSPCVHHLAVQLWPLNDARLPPT
jgi:hypothetical protein